jgi:hypothetical protein
VVPHHEYACDTDQDDEDGSDTGIEATPRLLALLRSRLCAGLGRVGCQSSH